MRAPTPLIALPAVGGLVALEVRDERPFDFADSVTGWGVGVGVFEVAVAGWGVLEAESAGWGVGVGVFEPVAAGVGFFDGVAAGWGVFEADGVGVEVNSDVSSSKYARQLASTEVRSVCHCLRISSTSQALAPRSSFLLEAISFAM